MTPAEEDAIVAAQMRADREACEREGHPEWDTAESPQGSWRYVRVCVRCGTSGAVVKIPR